MTNASCRFLLLACFAGALFAQGDRGSITGAVTDAGGSRIPAARITATQRETNAQFKATTTESGEFVLPSLPLGPYRVVIESDGFKSAARDNVRLESGSTVRLDTQLELGSVQQSIEIQGQSSQLQTDSAKIANQIPNKLIEDLPTVVSGNMRSPFDLANITAQVSGGDQDFRIGGGQQGTFGVMLDGASANTNRAGSTLWASVNAPSLDAITEFTVETNGFKAEFGRAGGGVISFVSKSGTNGIHGTAFDFIRNNAFDARGFFNSTTPVYRQHDFGATLGGPVRIPKLYNGRDKTFFFVSYEGFRNRVGGSTSAIALPPLEFYQGDFRNAVSRTLNPDGTYLRYTMYDPATTVYDPSISNYVRTPFPNNTIPQARFDPLSKKILDIAQSTMTSNLRKDVVPGTPAYWLENYYQNGTSVNPNNKFSVKFDHSLNMANRLSFYVGYSKRESVPGPSGPNGIPGILNTFSKLADTSPVYRGSWDRTISPRVHNRFYFGINQFKDSNYPLSEGMHWKDKICIPNVGDCDRNLPLITTGDFTQWGGNGFNGSENPIYSFNDDLTWNRGRHVFKTGYLYERAPYVGLGQQNGSGLANFGTATTQLPGQSSRNVGGGSGFASFELGLANGGGIHTPRRVGMLWRYHAMYFQDDWRIAPRLTLNLGVRYEFNQPTLNQDYKCADFDPTVPNPAAGGRPGALVFCGFGDGRVGRASIPPGWYKGIGPRLGISWNAQTNTVIRAGFGASYAPVKAVGGSAHFQGFSQIISFPDQTGGITPVFKLSEGMPYWPAPPFIDPTFGNNNSVDWWQGQEANRLPEMWSWNLSIQREFKGRLLVETGYSAIAGTHLQSNLLNYNQVNINTLPASLNIYTAAGRNLLSTAFNNSNRLIQQAGFSKPYAAFPDTSSLAQSLAPYPQYTGITTSSGGDHSGHSTYHSFLLKVTRRYASSLVIDASYVLSKMLTDSDSAWGSGAALNQYNRRLEKALSGSDRTHDAKINYVYELPIGPGKRWLKHGIVSQAIGGWRVGAVQRYASGTPMALTGQFGFPIVGNRPYITTYDGWRAPLAGDKFDPYVDRVFKPATIASFAGDVPTITTQGFFPLQPRDRPGNMTRTNPKMRNFPLYNEDVSLAKTFAVMETRRVDLRFEGFNLLNRTVFGTPTTSLSSSDFGLVRSQANSPRRLQFALKLIW
jgi:Carboxypeptidase regulatory-like domain